MCKDRNDFRTHWLRVTGTYFPSLKLPTFSPPEPPQSSGTALLSWNPDSGIDEASLPSDHDSDSPPTLPSHPKTPTQPIHLAPTANVLTRAQSKRQPVPSADLSSFYSGWSTITWILSPTPIPTHWGQRSRFDVGTTLRPTVEIDRPWRHNVTLWRRWTSVARATKVNSQVTDIRRSWNINDVKSSS